MKRTFALGSATRPGALPAVLGCTLLLLLLLPATAQDEVPLRLVYQGSALPSGTAVVVLQTPGNPGPTGNIQPRFLSMEEYPRDMGQIAGQDTLGERGRTTRAYRPTSSSDALYFLYAKAPDGTLYGSYSTERAMLKYDVVETGAMSVAPIDGEDRRAEIAARFFDEDAPGRASAGALEGAALGVAAGAQETQEEIPEEEDDAQEEAASENIPAETLMLGLGALALLFLLTTLFLLVRYQRLRTAHEDLMATHRAVTAARMTPERIRQLENELARMTRKYETVRQSCQTLLERYDRLSKQFDDARRVTKKSE